MDRAFLLLQQERYDLAEQEFKRQLSLDPQNYYLHAGLAECFEKQNRYKEAEREIRLALEIDSGDPYVHYVLCIILLNTKRVSEAKVAAREAVNLDPDDADYYWLNSAVSHAEEKWQDMLEWAEKGLEVEPDNQPCLNFRAIALVKLGRSDEAHDTIKQALEERPENAYSHANLGWTYLHAGNHTKALEHFGEALRLDPDLEWARVGLIETLKARYLFYRLILGYFLWMSRLPSNVRIGLIVGMFIVFRVLSSIKKQNPALSPYIEPFVVLYLIFVILTWVSAPVFDFMIQLHPLGRHSLKLHERLRSLLVVSFLVLALASYITSFFYTQGIFTTLSIYSLFMVVPLIRLFRNKDFAQKPLMLLITIGLGLIGPVGILLKSIGKTEIGSLLLSIFFISCTIMMWIGATRKE